MNKPDKTYQKYLEREVYFLELGLKQNKALIKDLRETLKEWDYYNEHPKWLKMLNTARGEVARDRKFLNKAKRLLTLHLKKLEEEKE